MFTGNSSTCPQQDARLVAHPLCAMRPTAERLPLTRPFSYSTPGASADGTRAGFSFVPNRGRHYPRYTRQTGSFKP